MKIQIEWLIFIMVANLVSGFIMNAKTDEGDYVVPGVEYHRELSLTGNVTEYEDQFNATEVTQELQPPTGTWEYVSHVFTTGYSFLSSIRWLFDGFPQMIDWWAGFLQHYGSISIFQQFGNILRAITAFMALTLILEFIRGVQILP